MFISFEGIDGSGKSTQARLLAETLRAEGREVVLTREPGGSEGAEQIRGLLVQGAGDRWSGETEALLFTAARRDHLERVIRPALDRGATVISDRFADSTRVYQGAARGGLGQFVQRLHDLAIGVLPDRTFLIDLDPAVALPRAGARQSGSGASPASAEDRFERLGPAFQQRLAEGFRALAAGEPGRIRLIDGSGSPAEVAARVRAAL